MLSNCPIFNVIPCSNATWSSLMNSMKKRKMNTEAQQEIELAGILVTNYETGAAGHALGEKILREWAKTSVYETRIRHSRYLYNAALSHQDIFSYAPESIGAQDYAMFCDEFVNKITAK